MKLQKGSGLTTPVGYYHFFYSSKDLEKLNNNIINEPKNKIEQFISKLYKNEYKENDSFNKFLSFENIVTTLNKGFYMGNNTNKLHINSISTSFMGKYMNYFMNNDTIMNEVSKKIDISVDKYIVNNNKNQLQNSKSQNIINKLNKINNDPDEKIRFLREISQIDINSINSINSKTELVNKNKVSNTKLIKYIKLYCNDATNISTVNETKKKCFNLSYFSFSFSSSKINVNKSIKNAKKVVKYLREKYSNDIDSYLIILVSPLHNKFIHNSKFIDLKYNGENLKINQDIEPQIFNNIENNIKKLNNKIEEYNSTYDNIPLTKQGGNKSIPSRLIKIGKLSILFPSIIIAVIVFNLSILFSYFLYPFTQVILLIIRSLISKEQNEKLKNFITSNTAALNIIGKKMENILKNF